MVQRMYRTTRGRLEKVGHFVHYTTDTTCWSALLSPYWFSTLGPLVGSHAVTRYQGFNGARASVHRVTPCKHKHIGPCDVPAATPRGRGAP